MQDEFVLLDVPAATERPRVEKAEAGLFVVEADTTTGRTPASACAT